MTTSIMSLASQVRSTIRRARHPTVAGTVRIEKQTSQPDPFTEFRDQLQGLHGRSLLPVLTPAAQRQTRLKGLLTGDIRETSFRHQIQKMDAGEVLAAVSSPATGLNLAYLAARAAPPGWRVELGAAFGIGTVAICLAEADTTNPVDGIEFEAWRAEIATEGARAILQDRATVHAGPIEDVLPHRAAKRPPIGFAFVDAMHTHAATTGYHNLIRRHTADNALVLYDDLGWSSEMEHAWKDIVASDAVTDAIRIDHRWGLARYRGAHPIETRL